MATIDYWDYNRHGSWTSGTTGTTSSSYTNAYDTSASPSYHYYRTYTVRKILITAPENWSEEQVMSFTELVNIKTKSGWIIRMVIKNGNITITDPDVERRTMNDFIPLLKKHCSNEDIQLINDFFSKNP